MMTVVVIAILIVVRVMTMPQLCLMLSRRRVDTSLRRFVQGLSRKSFLVPLFLLLSSPICKLLRTKMRLMNIGGNEKILFFVFFRSLLKFDRGCSRKAVYRLRWDSVQKTKSFASNYQLPESTLRHETYGLTQIHIPAALHHPSADLELGQLHEERWKEADYYSWYRKHVIKTHSKSWE
jgi:hypothetical protein